MSRIKLVTCGMQGTNTREIFEASQKNYDGVKNGMCTTKFRIRQDNPLANDLMGGLQLLKVYRSTVANPSTYSLLMVGDVISATETADESGASYVDVVAADPMWRLTKRLIGLGAAYTASSAQVCTIMSNIMAALNNVFHCGIDMGTVATTYTTTYGPVFFQNVADAFTQFAATLGGPDFVVAPREPLYDPGGLPGAAGGLQTRIATLNTYAVLGSTKPEAIFDYGGGKDNVLNYQRIVTKDAMANTEYALPQGYPDAVAPGDGPAEVDASTEQYTYGLMQDVIQQSVVTNALRLTLCQEYIAVRKVPRQQLTFTPITDCPVDFKQHYDVGDIVTARAYDKNSKQWIYDGTVRVHGVNINYDDQDRETIALTLIPA